jgi:zinc transporter ZupT
MKRLVWVVVPVAAVVATIAWIVFANPLTRLTAGAPPVEEVKVEAVRLEPGRVELSVRADGSAPVAIAQVQVDGAYRSFLLDPPEPIGRLGRAQILIDYPWIKGEAHHFVLVLSSGATVEHTLDVASPTPALAGGDLGPLVLVGLVLGLVPVAAGLLFFPALRGLSARANDFLLAVTVGLLFFLLADTLIEGIEAGARANERLHGGLLVLVAGAATAAALIAFGRRSGRPPEGVALALYIAFGIGLHNFGEGLAVGAALATGAAALATFLMVGFVLHNVSEGFGIAVPMLARRPPLAVFAGLAALAGLPAVPGVLLGAQSVGPLWQALCLGIGAGAILQVIVEVAALIARRSGSAGLLSPASLAGAVVGLAVMYSTALLV